MHLTTNKTTLMQGVRVTRMGRRIRTGHRGTTWSPRRVTGTGTSVTREATSKPARHMVCDEHRATVHEGWRERQRRQLQGTPRPTRPGREGPMMTTPMLPVTTGPRRRAVHRSSTTRTILGRATLRTRHQEAGRVAVAVTNTTTLPAGPVQPRCHARQWETEPPTDRPI